MFAGQRDSSKVYKVTLVNEEQDVSHTISVYGDEYILDAAEAQGVQLPYSCRSGNCFHCVGRVLKGAVDQYDHSFLKEKELEAGFTLLCASYPVSDCLIQTHQEEAMLDL
jgi:ferredoxin